MMREDVSGPWRCPTTSPIVLAPYVACTHTINLHQVEKSTYLCGEESNISKCMHITSSGQRSLSYPSEFSILPSFSLVSPGFPPFLPFVSVSPTLAPVFRASVSLKPCDRLSSPLHPAAKRRLVAYCSRILGTLDHCTSKFGRGMGAHGWGRGGPSTDTYNIVAFCGGCICVGVVSMFCICAHLCFSNNSSVVLGTTVVHVMV